MIQILRRLSRLILAFSAVILLSGCVADALTAGAMGQFSPTHDAASQKIVRLTQAISTERFKSVVQDTAVALKYDVSNVSPSGNKFVLNKNDNMALTFVGMHDTITVDIIRVNDLRIEISVQEVGNFGQANKKSAGKIVDKFKGQIQRRA